MRSFTRPVVAGLAACLLVVSACSPESVPSPPTTAAVTSTAVDGVTTTAGHDDHGTTAAPGTAAPGSTVPPADADRVLSGTESFPDGIVVPAGEVWAFDPAVTTVVESAANVVVEGTLVMRPSSAQVEHVLRFVGVDPSGFAGGGMDPVAGDVGLWVMGDGALDVAGTAKPAWDTVWHDEWAGDEVVAAPHLAGDIDGFTPVGGPGDVPPPNELGIPTELLNLTRNVSIEGTPQGYSHIFIRSTRPQTIRFAGIRYMAPDLVDASVRDRGQSSTGRYALHLHHNMDGSRGTLIEGVVVRDAGNHAFVPHASHGVTFRDTIAYDTLNAAYWWDRSSSRTSPENASDDIVYERAVAARVRGDQTRTGAFELGEGNNLAITGSVAVGVQRNGRNGSGFFWPGGEDGSWVFEGNVSHNNDGAGLMVWQNTGGTHVIEDFTAYHNEDAGVSHGAYRNAYVYRDLTLLANGERRGSGIAVESHAVGRPADDGSTAMQLWDGVHTDGGVLRTFPQAQDAEAPVRFVDCDFSRVILGEGEGHSSVYEFVGCGLTPDMVTVEYMNPRSQFRVQDGTEAWELLPDGSVVEIEPFV